jgi:hypothetical protein
VDVIGSVVGEIGDSDGVKACGRLGTARMGRHPERGIPFPDLFRLQSLICVF